MARERKAKMYLEHRTWAARFWHPVRKKVVRVSLGANAGEAEHALNRLNEILQNDSQWDVPPAGTPACVLVAWGGGAPKTIELRDGRTVVMLPADHPDAQPIEPAEPTEAEIQQIVDITGDDADDGPDVGGADRVFTPEELRLRRLIRERDAEIRRLRQIIKDRDGHYPRHGPPPLLGKARDAFLASYPDWDKDYATMVRLDLARFVNEFGEHTPVDDLQDRESKIETWLRSLTVHHMKKDKATGEMVPTERHGKPLGAQRRNSIRRHVLRFLAENKVLVDRKKITRKTGERPSTRRLTREQAWAVLAALPPYWADVFNVQVALGLRPDELITLKKSDFPRPDFSMLSLSPLGNLTLKQGTREIQVPEPIREIIKRRLADNAVVFPNPKTDKPWGRAKWYDRKYNRALNRAAEAAGIPFKIDCRTGRRTGAQLLLDAGKPVEDIAAILGHTPKVLRDHYAKRESKDVDPSAAVLGDAPTAKDGKRKAGKKKQKIHRTH